jgi:thymidylate kinase
MDRLVRSGMAYEKNARQVNYNQIQKYCGEALKDASPSTSNLMELSAYFTLCEFNAYISKKVV